MEHASNLIILIATMLDLALPFVVVGAIAWMMRNPDKVA